MTLVKRDPWREIEDLFSRYSRGFGLPANREVVAGDWAPRVDIAETEKEFLITAELPGVDKADVKVTVDNGLLTLCGERHQETEEEDKRFHRVERHYGSFTRSFTLPDATDATAVKAAYDDGVLTIEVPKTEVEEPEALEVPVG